MHQPAMGLRLELQKISPRYRVRISRTASLRWQVWDNENRILASKRQFDSYDAAEQFAEKLNRA